METYKSPAVPVQPCPMRLLGRLSCVRTQRILLGLQRHVVSFEECASATAGGVRLSGGRSPDSPILLVVHCLFRRTVQGRPRPISLGLDRQIPPRYNACHGLSSPSNRKEPIPQLEECGSPLKQRLRQQLSRRSQLRFNPPFFL